MKSEEQAELLKDIEEIVKRREARAEKKDISAPMVKVNMIKKNRTPPGTGRSIVFGIPIDVFDLEDMVIKVSPTDLKTMLRFESSRIIEQMRNSERISSDDRKPFNWTIILVLIIIIAIVVGVLLFLPKILAFLGGVV